MAARWRTNTNAQVWFRLGTSQPGLSCMSTGAGSARLDSSCVARPQSSLGPRSRRSEASLEPALFFWPSAFRRPAGRKSPASLLRLAARRPTAGWVLRRAPSPPLARNLQASSSKFSSGLTDRLLILERRKRIIGVDSTPASAGGGIRHWRLPAPVEVSVCTGTDELVSWEASSANGLTARR